MISHSLAVSLATASLLYDRCFRNVNTLSEIFYIFLSLFLKGFSAILFFKEYLHYIREKEYCYEGFIGCWFSSQGREHRQVVEYLSNNLEGVDQELIYLSDYELCTLAFAVCAVSIQTSCVQQDGWDHIQSCLMEADVLILGFPTYYAFSLGFNAMTHVFLERWFALRHLGVKLKLKKIICVVSSGTSPEVAQKA